MTLLFKGVSVISQLKIYCIFLREQKHQKKHVHANKTNEKYRQESNLQAAALLPTSSADVQLVTATLEPDNREAFLLLITAVYQQEQRGCCFDYNRSMPELACALKRYQGQRSGGIEAVQ